MSALALGARHALARTDRPVAAILVVLGVLAALAPLQAEDSLRFVLDALLEVAPFLALSVALAAYAKASGTDALVARAFRGRMWTMVPAAALMGAASPFCSCGVIPLIAALLAMGVPLAPVMAFWLASPLMDPSMFLLTAGTLGLGFATFKALAAFAIGIMGGAGIVIAMRGGALGEPLRPGVGDGGCGGAAVRAPGAVAWRFWTESERRAAFTRSAADSAWFLGKWLVLAFLLQSLMVAYLPAGAVSRLIGGEGILAVLSAAALGIPAYLNGYAALPLVGGLMEQGMSAGAGMAFLLAGGVSCIPAALAVWALARPPVFLAYLGLAFLGALSLGLAYGLLS